MGEWQIEHLGARHERREFSCGKPSLDAFLQELARQYEKRNLGRTYVAVRSGEPRVYGYYTLVAGAIEFGKLPPLVARKLPTHPVPVILLARMAVDEAVRGKGLGRFLLFEALRRSHEISEVLGVHAIGVDAIDLDAQAFYQNFGFEPILEDPLYLYLPMTTVAVALQRRRRNQ